MTTRIRMPNVSTTQRMAGTGAIGEIVFDTTDQNFYQGTSAMGPNNWMQIRGGIEVADPGSTTYTQLADFNVDNSNPEFYNTTFGRHTIDIVMQNAAAAAPYPVGTRLAITAGTVTTASEVAANIIFAGEVLQNGENPNLGDFINISVDEAYRANVAAIANASGQIAAATVESWNVWQSSVDFAGVVVRGENNAYSVEGFEELFATYGAVSEGDQLPTAASAQHIQLFILRHQWVDNTVTYSPGLYERTRNTNSPTDWQRVGQVQQNDYITFTTEEDVGETAVHTYTGVTVLFDAGDPAAATITFASEDDAFSFFALTGARNNNGTSTRAVTVTYGSATLVFPIGLIIGPQGGPDMLISNRSVVTGGFAVQSTPTDFVIDASAEVPVHVTGNNFNLIAGGDVDIDLNTTTNAITIGTTPRIWQGTNNFNESTPLLINSGTSTSLELRMAQTHSLGGLTNTLAVEGTYRFSLIANPTQITGVARVRVVPWVRVGGTHIFTPDANADGGGYIRGDTAGTIHANGGQVSLDRIVTIGAGGVALGTGVVTAGVEMRATAGSPTVDYGIGYSNLIIERLS